MTTTDTDTRILDALRNRRSMARVKPDLPPRECIEQILEAATWAPNHYRTSPWRFVVLSGSAREELGAIMAASLAARLEDAEDEETPDHETDALLEKERRKPLRAPVVIAVACVPSSAPKVSRIEEVCAAAAAVQNMLLAAEAVGLGAMWRTGKPTHDPAVRQYLALPEEAELIAFVYVGYPDIPSQHERDRDWKPFTTWLGDGV